MEETQSEHCADPNDLASRTEIAFTTEAIAEVRARLAPQHHVDFDGTHCLDCGTPIPRQRLATGRIRCAPCETVVEQIRKRYR